MTATMTAKIPNWQREESDRLVWSDVAQCMRVAGDIVTNESTLPSRPAFRYVYLANASAEIAKARELARYIFDPDMRRRARFAISRIATHVRAEQRNGV